MSNADLTIRSVAARPVDAPLKRPVRTAMGTLPSAPLVLIDVATEQGVIGRAYIFGYTRVALAPLAKLVADIGAELRGKPVAPAARLRELDRRFRLLGWQGLVGMAVSGIEMALWDALGRALNAPVVRLLGGEPTPLPAYDSYGAIDPKADERAIAETLAQGFAAIKIKLGEGGLERDLDVVRAVRGMIGARAALMVDYNQSLDAVEARRRIARLAEFDLHWVEEPVPAEDLAGHAKVRQGSPVPIQTGENWWFPRGMAAAVAAGACDYAMLDIMKIGGFTGWLAAAGQAEAASLPVSSHLFIEASAHVLPVTPTAHWLEHLDIAGAILAEPNQVRDGTVTAKGPGLGIAWNEAAVAKYGI
jgi:mandelate racemase